MQPCATKLLLLFLFLNPCIGELLSNEIWVARIHGGEEVAQLIAAAYGFKYISPTPVQNDIYILRRPDSLVHKRAIKEITGSKEVEWAERQVTRPRFKRGIFSWLHSNYRRVFNDALWPKEWYIQDYRTTKSAPILDLNVVPCYAYGVTGAGVRIVVVDDGLEKDHIDIKDNYDPEISCDLNEGDLDPTPRYDEFGTNSHGTKCAGEIAMVANNQVCGVGIAFNASIGGIKLLDGPTTDLMESTALTYMMEVVDIYSNSWGPSDDGRSMEGPGKLTILALEKGATQGRKGKGNIYIFASGNGKLYGDNCGADGYINSIYTIAIASASQEGKTVFYGERCAAIMATAYSSGNSRNEMIATTSLNNTCTLRHTGTSAAAPLAAGIAALVLQANNETTWRDLQHMIVWTSEVGPLAGNPDWDMNGAGIWFSPDFGFGLLNAYNLVRFAEEFVTVPPKSICIVPVRIRGSRAVLRGVGSKARVSFMTHGCHGTSHEINFIEHVELLLGVNYPRRGSLSVHLSSPSGTYSTLLEKRFRDEARSGLNDWSMTSVHFWGENPVGLWTATIKTRAHEEDDWIEWEGRVKRMILTIHGTQEMPEHYKNGPRTYAPFE